MAIASSVRCPGDLIVKAYDVAKILREQQIPVISGFHTPVEKDCLEILLRGEQSITVCPARSIEGMRIPLAWRPAIEQGRLTIASPFPARQRRPTKALARARNRYVVEQADQTLIIYAEPGGETESLARYVIETGRPLFTIDDPANENLVNIGAAPVCANGPIDWAHQ